MEDVAAADPCFLAALPRKAFVTVGSGCEARCLCAIAAAAQIPPDCWTYLAQSFSLDPSELGVAAANRRAFAIALAFLAHLPPNAALPPNAELLGVLKGAALALPLRLGDSVWSLADPAIAGRPWRTTLVQFPEVMEVMKKVKIQAYLRELLWMELSVHVTSVADLHAVWQRACAEGAESFDGRNGVDCRFWLAPGQHGIKRHRDMVVEGRNSSGSLTVGLVTVHICPTDFEPTPDAACLRGWADERSMEHFQTYLTSPGLSFAENMETFNKSKHFGYLPRTTGHGAQGHLVVAATCLALHAAGRTLRRVVSTGALHGFGIRASPDLVVETDEGLTAVEFFAQAQHNFRKATLGDPPEYFPDKVFQNLICAAKLACQNALTVFYSYQASTVYWQLIPVPPAFRPFVADVAAAWFPDGRLRLELFRGLARNALRSASVGVCLAQLPKDVCAQPFCLAGVRCRKQRHLYAVRDARQCTHFFDKGRCKHGDMCRNHHGGDVVLYEADGSEPDWASAGIAKGGKKKEKKKQAGSAASASPVVASSGAPIFDSILQGLQPQF